jgi:hypothetical protein
MCTWNPKKIWISNSIFNLWVSLKKPATFPNEKYKHHVIFTVLFYNTLLVRTLKLQTMESQSYTPENPRLVPHVRSLNSRNPGLKLSFIPAEFVKTTARALFILLSLSEVQYVLNSLETKFQNNIFTLTQNIFHYKGDFLSYQRPNSWTKSRQKS